MMAVNIGCWLGVGHFSIALHEVYLILFVRGWYKKPGRVWLIY
jgi:hypothetical protein